MSDKLSPMMTYCGSAVAAGCSVWGKAGIWLVEHHQLISSIGIVVGMVCAITGATVQVLGHLKKRRGK